MSFNDKQKKIICGVIAICMVVPILIGAIAMMIPQ